MGLKRIKMEYWTDEQLWFLMDAYHTMGDLEIAIILEIVSPKEKPWTKNHIDKKRKYLKLYRTEDELLDIKKRHGEFGCYQRGSVKHWKDRVSPVGTVKKWKNQKTGKYFLVIKTESGFVHFVPWLYEQLHGPVPAGFKVRVRDGNPENVVPENLELVTEGDNARLNSVISSQGLSDNYVAGILSHNQPGIRSAILQSPGLIELKRNELLLSRAIKLQEYERTNKQ